jgi:hypothetical protein
LGMLAFAVHGTTRLVPREAYQRHEKPHMQPRRRPRSTCRPGRSTRCIPISSTSASIARACASIEGPSW